MVHALLEIRQRQIVPRLAGARAGGRFEILDGVLCIAWPLAAAATLRHALNFSDAATTLPQAPSGRRLYSLGAQETGGALRMAPWSVYVALETGGG